MISEGIILLFIIYKHECVFQDFLKGKVNSTPVQSSLGNRWTSRLYH